MESADGTGQPDKAERIAGGVAVIVIAYLSYLLMPAAIALVRFGWQS